MPQQARLPLLILLAGALAIPLAVRADYHFRVLQVESSLVGPTITRADKPDEFQAVLDRLDQWVKEGKVQEMMADSLRAGERRKDAMKKVKTGWQTVEIGWRVDMRGSGGPRSFEIREKPAGADQRIIKLDLFSPLKNEWTLTGMVIRERLAIYFLERELGSEGGKPGPWLALQAMETQPTTTSSKPWETPMRGDMLGHLVLRLPSSGTVSTRDLHIGQTQKLQNGKTVVTGLRGGFTADVDGRKPAVSGNLTVMTLSRTSFQSERTLDTKMQFALSALDLDEALYPTQRPTTQSIEYRRGGDDWWTEKNTVKRRTTARFIFFDPPEA